MSFNFFVLPQIKYTSGNLIFKIFIYSIDLYPQYDILSDFSFEICNIKHIFQFKYLLGRGKRRSSWTLHWWDLQPVWWSGSGKIKLSFVPHLKYF